MLPVDLFLFTRLLESNVCWLSSPTPILTFSAHQVGVTIGFSSDPDSHKTVPTSDGSHRSGLHLLLTNQLLNQGSHLLLIRFNNMLELLTKLRNTFYLLLPVYYKDTTQEQPNGGEVQTEVRGGACYVELPSPLQGHYLNMHNNPEALDPTVQGVLQQVSLYRHD